MFRLFIDKTGDNEWVELELNGSESLNFTFIRSDIEDLQNRNSSFSQNIELPGTQTNRKNLEHIYNLDKITPNLDLIYINKLFNCEYILDDLSFRAQLELESISILNETDEIIFNCSIRSTSILIKDKIGDKLLVGNRNKTDDLDFTEYKHIFNATNVKNSWTSTAGSGYYYPIINYTNYGATNNIPLSSQRPALYAKEVIDKIFEDAGLTYESDFLNSNEFKKVIHPWIAKTESDPDELRQKEIRVGLTDLTKETKLLGFGTKWLNETIIYDNDSNTGTLNFYDNPNKYNTTTGFYEVPSGGMYRLSFLATLLPVLTRFSVAGNLRSNSGARSDIKTEIRVVRGNQTLVLGSTTTTYRPVQGRSIFVSASYSDSVQITDQKMTIVVETPEVQLYTGDLIYVNFSFNHLINFVTLSGQGGITSSLKYRFFRQYDSGEASSVLQVKAIQTQNIFLGETINPIGCFSENTRQYDYFKSIMNLFNLVISEDLLNFTNFVIEPRVEVIGKNNKYYWDDRIDNDSVIEINRIPTLIRKNVKFSYKDDKDFYNQDYFDYFGDTYGSYVKRNRENTDENYEISVLFSQTPHNYHNNSKVILPQLYQLNDKGVVQLGNAFNMRVLYRTDIPINNTDFQVYTGSIPFSIFLTGDQFGLYTETLRITNNPWYSIGSVVVPLPNVITTIHTANHFENPYSQNSSDLNFGFQQSYYVVTRGIYPSSNNLYNRFWADYIETIIDVDSKIIKVTAKLSVKDIYDLTFDDVIVFNSQKFVINKISDWTKDNLCSVELIKIKE
jgi:hypothetical protein